MHAAELRTVCIGQVEVREAAPQPERHGTDQGILTATDPADPAAGKPTRNIVREQEVQRIDLGKFYDDASGRHDVDAFLNVEVEECWR
ncbi:MAG TPA: hypothetical protein VGI23_22360 [Steroidobacteraceae bacterium]